MSGKSDRKFLTHHEVMRILTATRAGRYAARDECLFHMCFIHGFRVSELCFLRLSDFDFGELVVYVRRLKHGLSTTHPLTSNEMAPLRRWLMNRAHWRDSGSDWLFLSQKGGHLSRKQVYNLLRNYANQANIIVNVHPHMLRHACGYALANAGADTRLIQDYLGHINIRHTVIYTASNAERFNGLWQEK